MSESDKKQRENSEIDAEINRSIKKRVALIIIAIVAVCGLVFLFAHHTVVQHHNEQIRQSRQMNKSIKIQTEKNNHNNKMLTGNHIGKHATSRQKRIVSVVKGLNNGFRQKKTPARAYYDASEYTLIYEFTGQLAKSWEGYTVAQNVGSTRLHMSQAKYNNMCNSLKKQHNKIAQMVHGMQSQVQHDVGGSDMPYRVVGVHRFSNIDDN